MIRRVVRHDRALEIDERCGREDAIVEFNFAGVHVGDHQMNEAALAAILSVRGSPDGRVTQPVSDRHRLMNHCVARREVNRGGDRDFARDGLVATTIYHEVGNVAKCLRAGFTRVVLICQIEERLRKLEKAIATSLGPDVSVGYFQPDQFIAELRNMAPAVETPPAPDQPAVRRGYKVKRKVVTSTYATLIDNLYGKSE